MPPTGIPSLALRKRHKQILEKAIRGLEEQSVENRNYQAITACIDPDLLPEAEKKIQKFMWELCSFLESGKRREVYELSLSLFSLEAKKARENAASVDSNPVRNGEVK